jgi:hypothetical protein
MKLTNITPDASQNIGGLEVVFFTLLENITQWPVTDGLIMKGDLALKPGTEFYMMGYTRFTSSYEQPMKNTRHGAEYRLEQKGFIPTDTPELGNALKKMEQGKYALLFRDKNGYLRITPPHYYTEFTYRLTKPDAPSDRPGYKVEFEGESPLPAYYYSGAFPVAELGEVKTPVNSGYVTIRFNGQNVKVVPAGHALDILSDYTLDFEIKLL